MYRRWWGERRVDGVFVTDLRDDDVRIPVLQELQLPAVVIGGPGDTGIDRADLVRRRGRGHRGGALPGRARAPADRPGRRSARTCCTPRPAPRRSPRSAPRSGWTSAVTVPSDYTGEEGGRATRRLLIDAERPTAIIYDNDVMAVAGLAVAQEMGLTVPADLSIVAWDDSPLCSLVHPPLTALSRDIAEYGAHAARQLLAAIDGKPVHERRGRHRPPDPARQHRPAPKAGALSRSAWSGACRGRPRCARPVPGGPARTPGRTGSPPRRARSICVVRLQTLGHDLQAEPAAEADHHVDHRRAVRPRSGVLTSDACPA